MPPPIPSIIYSFHSPIEMGAIYVVFLEIHREEVSGNSREGVWYDYLSKERFHLKIIMMVEIMAI